MYENKKYWRARALVDDGATIDDAVRRTGISRREFDCIQTVIDDPFRWHSLAQTFEHAEFEQLTPDQVGTARRELGALLKTFFSRPPPPRMKKHEPAAQRLADALKEAFAAMDDMPEHARWELEELCELSGRRARYLDVLTRVRPFSEKYLPEYLAALADFTVDIGDAAGGRRRDKRIERFVPALADYYLILLRQPATYEVRRGSPSHFFTFVEDALIHFLPELIIPDRAVSDAVRSWAGRLPRPRSKRTAQSARAQPSRKRPE